MFPDALPLLKMLLPCSMVYHWPAPRTVVWSICSADPISNRPEGTHSSRPCERAAARPVRNACESSEESLAVAP
jgi:hypothetical protein